MKSVRTDMSKHTVTVAFDDDEITIDEIVTALGKAGYAVPNKQQLN